MRVCMAKDRIKLVVQIRQIVSGHVRTLEIAPTLKIRLAAIIQVFVADRTILRLVQEAQQEALQVHYLYLDFQVSNSIFQPCIGSVSKHSRYFIFLFYMKYSIYNSVIPLTDKSSMLYNASSDKFLIFKKQIQILLRTSTPEEILIKHPNFYQQLKESGAIIDDSLDEVGKMISIGKNVNEDLSQYRLIINPTMNCNFRCWYCYETHLPNTKMTNETIDRVRKLILLIIAKNKDLTHFSLSFFGGEPLLYYKDTVAPIIDFLREECSSKELTYTIHFTTNGFLVNNRVIEHLTTKRDHKSFQITLDGHREKHNKVRFSSTGTGSYDRIVANIKKLLAVKINVGLRINYTMENATSIKEILTDLNDIPNKDRNYLEIDFQKVWQDDRIRAQNEYLLDESLTAFKKEFPYVSDRYNNVNGLKSPCYADFINESIINYNGDVFKCTARDFKSFNRCGQLSENGEIIWDDIFYMKKLQKVRFEKKICRQCRIFPLCGGGCSQRAIESFEKEECIRLHNELEKDKIILARFYNNVVKPPQHESTSVQTT